MKSVAEYQTLSATHFHSDETKPGSVLSLLFVARGTVCMCTEKQSRSAQNSPHCIIKTAGGFTFE